MKPTKSNHIWKFDAGIVSFDLLGSMAGGRSCRSLLTPNGHNQPSVLEALQSEVEQLKDNLKGEEPEAISESVLDTAQKTAPSIVTIPASQTLEKQSVAIVTSTDFKFYPGYPDRSTFDRSLNVSGLLIDRESRVGPSARAVALGIQFRVPGKDRVRRSSNFGAGRLQLPETVKNISGYFTGAECRSDHRKGAPNVQHSAGQSQNQYNRSARFGFFQWGGWPGNY